MVSVYMFKCEKGLNNHETYDSPSFRDGDVPAPTKGQPSTDPFRRWLKELSGEIAAALRRAEACGEWMIMISSEN